MIFTSFEFVLFFALVLAGRSLCRSLPAEKWFLLVASYVFYMSWSVPFGLLILATSLVDYGVGLGLNGIVDQRKRKLLLTISLVANLGVLAFFKYTNFLLANVESVATMFGLHLARWHYDIILPAGISFFTFQSMSYTISVYRRQIEPCRSLRDFLLFVAFFPQLLAGPIVRAAECAGTAQNRPSIRGTNRNSTAASGSPSASVRAARRNGRTGVFASTGRWTRASAAVSSQATTSV